MEGKSEASRGGFKGFKERSLLCNLDVQGEDPSAEGEAAASYPANYLAKTINAGSLHETTDFQYR